MRLAAMLTSGCCLAGPPQGDVVADIAVGPNHACARYQNGVVRCWGDGTGGALGDGKVGFLGNDLLPERPYFATEPVTANVTDISAIAVGRGATAFLRTDGSLFAAGLEPALNATGRPRRVEGMGRVVAVSAADDILARDESGAVYQLQDFGDAPVRQEGLPAADAIAGSCARASGHWHARLFSFGGEPPVVVAGVDGATSIASSSTHHCARMADATVRCWGWSSEPAAIDGLTDVEQVAVGEEFSCARTATGAVLCWGSGDRGQLGVGGDGETLGVPTAVKGIASAKQIAAGGSTACALDRNGSVWCWGANDRGQLGVGDTTDRFEPVEVKGLTAP